MNSLDTLMVDVRASTDGFAADIGQMRHSFDSILVDGFSRAGDALERGLLGAVRKGSLSFEDLRRTALNVIDQIAAQALQAGLGSIGLGGGSGNGGIGGLLNLGSVIGSALGLPGRATGGPVSPGTAYVVGERGPEMFVPTSAGRIETGGSGSGARNVNVSIRVVSPEGASHPESLRRSSRQVAQAVRRALNAY
jgi:phage-related minor tail protein